MEHGKETVDEILHSWYRYIIVTVGLEKIWLMRYSDCPPGLFAGLLREESKPATLETMKRQWDALQKLEHLALKDEALSDELSNLCFSDAPWVRDVFIGGDECCFEDVPDEVVHDVEGMASGLGGTKGCEDLFNELRDETRHSKAGILGRKKRYFQMLNSTGLRTTERGGTYGKSLEARTLSSLDGDVAALFDRPSEDKFSLGKEVLTHIMEKQLPQSSKSYLEIPLHWHLLQRFQDNIEDRELAWFSLLAIRGYCAYNKTTSERGIVVYNCVSGLLLLKPLLLKSGDTFYLKFPENAEGKIVPSISYTVVTNPCEWTLRPVTPVLPRSKHGHLFKERVTVLALLPAEKVEMLGANALTGFRGLTVPYMKKMVTHFQIKYEGAKPQREKELATLLVSWALPFKSEDVDRFSKQTA